MRKTTEYKYNLIKAMYSKYNCFYTVARKLGIHHTTAMFWLGKLKNKKPKYQFPKKTPKVGINEYRKTIMLMDYTTDDPVKEARQLRKEFIDDYGVKPEDLSPVFTLK